MEISDEAVDAAIKGAHPLIFEWLTLPYGASVSDYPSPDDLRAADEVAEKANNELLRSIFRAGLEAANPALLALAREQQAKLDAVSAALQQLMSDYNYSHDINYADLEALNAALTTTEAAK